MKTFDFYEFAGVLCPGVVILYSISMILPRFAPIVHDQSISVGTLGLFVVLSYVAGHLVQAIGNLLEPAIWRIFGGMPTDWVRTRKHTLLAEQQITLLEQRIKDQGCKPLSALTRNEWASVIRSIYAAAQNAGRTTRVDVFNGNYGLFRGIAASFLLSAFSLRASPSFRWSTCCFLITCALLAIYRMRRFGIHYARELFVQFLELPAAMNQGGKP